jgi:hypothetical protein
MTAVKAAKAASVKPPKPTAAEKAAAKKLQDEQRAREREERAAEFERNRPQLWSGLWAKALRLQLFIDRTPEVAEKNNWWFNEFRVDLHEQTFCIECMGSGTKNSEKSLHAADLDRIMDSLESGLEMVNDHFAEVERLRLEAEEMQRRRAVALAKLSDEDKKALNLR